MAPPWPTVRFPLYHQPNVDGFVSSRRKKPVALAHTPTKNPVQRSRCLTVLAKPKILTVPTSWLREYQEGGRARYVLSASDYQRLVDAVRR